MTEQIVEKQKKKEQEPIQVHDSSRVFATLKARRFKAISLAKRRTEMKKIAVFNAIMIALIIVFGTFTGIALYHYVINPPEVVNGVCQSPAQITHGGCFIVQCSSVSGKNVCNYIPSGTIEKVNATK